MCNLFFLNFYINENKVLKFVFIRLVLEYYVFLKCYSIEIICNCSLWIIVLWINGNIEKMFEMNFNVIVLFIKIFSVNL